MASLQESVVHETPSLQLGGIPVWHDPLVQISGPLQYSPSSHSVLDVQPADRLRHDRVSRNAEIWANSWQPKLVRMPEQAPIPEHMIRQQFVQLVHPLQCAAFQLCPSSWAVSAIREVIDDVKRDWESPYAQP